MVNISTTVYMSSISYSPPTQYNDAFHVILAINSDYLHAVN